MDPDGDCAPARRPGPGVAVGEDLPQGKQGMAQNRSRQKDLHPGEPGLPVQGGRITLEGGRIHQGQGHAAQVGDQKHHERQAGKGNPDSVDHQMLVDSPGDTVTGRISLIRPLDRGWGGNGREPSAPQPGAVVTVVSSNLP